MATQRPVAEKHFFTLRVALAGVSPPIWRRLVTPGAITLDLLHDALNLTMGWEDYHLHEFAFGRRRFTEGPEESDEGEDERGVRLDALIDGPRAKFTYTYDFGDDWKHAVTVESIAPVPAGHLVQLACVAGKRSCPPEDVGGPFGYANYLAALADSEHPEHEAMLGWRGPFDPEAFDIEAANRELGKLTRWSRPRRR